MFLFLAACSSPPALPEPLTQEAVTEQAAWYADDARRVGGEAVFAVSRGGALSASTEGGADADTPFRIGSVSKLFTAIAVLRLHEDGLVDLDQPLADQLPDFAIQTRGDLPPITPREVLSHHAGLPSDHYPGMFSDRPLHHTQLAGLMAQEVRAEGGYWAYSNVGYGILGHLVEQASGQAFEDYVAETLFEPCGMDSSHFDPEQVPDGTLAGKPSPEPAVGNLPAAGAVSTAADLVRFGHGLLGSCEEALLSPSGMAEAMQPWHTDPRDLDLQQGLGFELFLDQAWLGDHDVVGHSGDTLVFHAQLLVAPDLDAVVVGLTNESDVDVSEPAFELMRMAIELETGERPEPVPETPRARNTPLSKTDLDALVGVYGTQLGVLAMERRGNGLKTNLVGHPLKLVPTEQGTFRTKPIIAGVVLPFWIPLEFGFFEIDGELTVGLRGEEGGPTWMPLGSRFEPAAASGAWGDALGSWVPVDNEGDALTLDAVHLDEDDGYLVMTIDLVEPADSIAMPMGLLPQGDGTAVIGGTSRRAGETVFLSEDGTRLRYAGYTFERLEEAGGCAHLPAAPAWWGLLPMLVLFRREGTPNSRSEEERPASCSPRRTTGPTAAMSPTGAYQPSSGSGAPSRSKATSA